MRAARIHAFGGSEKVRIEQVVLPRMKKNAALIRVRAAAVNPVDWMVRERIYNPRGADKVPLTLGQDFAGVIEEIAPGSRTSFRKATRSSARRGEASRSTPSSRSRTSSESRDPSLSSSPRRFRCRRSRPGRW
jgi:NADPH:quinone reductase-like Zn-dependent oxidoreductase